jgi:hypothetical protein
MIAGHRVSAKRRGSPKPTAVCGADLSSQGNKLTPPRFQYVTRAARRGRSRSGVMDEKERARLQHQAELAARVAEAIKDESTARRLKNFAEEVRQKLLRLLRRSKVRARAYELWEAAGRPPDRDLEFWLEAEQQISEEQRD